MTLGQGQWPKGKKKRRNFNVAFLLLMSVHFVVWKEVQHAQESDKDENALGSNRTWQVSTINMMTRAVVILLII